MAPTTTQFISVQQTIMNNVLVVSEQTCAFICNEDISNNTIIIIGGTGSVNVTQECTLKDLSCIMQNSIDTEIQNAMSAMLDQTTTDQASWTINFADINEYINLTQYMQNSITQIMESTCTFETTQTVTGNYFYVEDRNGDFNLSQTSTIANSNCNMDNSAKSTSYNNESTDTSQTSKITGPATLIFIAIIIAVVMVGIIAIVFILSGGVAIAAQAAGKGGAPGGTTGTETSSSSSATSSAITAAVKYAEANPEVFEALLV